MVADSQHAGRGRLGRTWSSPAGEGLLVSILLRPSLPSSQVHLLVFVAGCAAAEAIESVTGLAVGLKWPNDLYLGARKAGGVLVEAGGDGEAVAWVIVGIGINVNTEVGSLPSSVSHSATSLMAALDAPVDREELLAALLHRLDAGYMGALHCGFGAALRGFRDRDQLLGRHISVQTKDGPTRGCAAGIGEHGELLVRLPDQTLRRFRGGEVTLSGGP